MQRPGFCVLLSIGIWMSVLGIVAGMIITGLGVSTWETNRNAATINLIVGIACVIQSLVFLGILQAIQWMVDRLLAISGPQLSPESQPVGTIAADEPELDGIRHKPVLKRRKFAE